MARSLGTRSKGQVRAGTGRRRKRASRGVLFGGVIFLLAMACVAIYLVHEVFSTSQQEPTYTDDYSECVSRVLNAETVSEESREIDWASLVLQMYDGSVKAKNSLALRRIQDNDLTLLLKIVEGCERHAAALGHDTWPYRYVSIRMRVAYVRPGGNASEVPRARVWAETVGPEFWTDPRGEVVLHLVLPADMTEVAVQASYEGVLHGRVVVDVSGGNNQVHELRLSRPGSSLMVRVRDLPATQVGVVPTVRLAVQWKSKGSNWVESELCSIGDACHTESLDAAGEARFYYEGEIAAIRAWVVHAGVERELNVGEVVDGTVIVSWRDDGSGSEQARRGTCYVDGSSRPLLVQRCRGKSIPFVGRHADDYRRRYPHVLAGCSTVVECQ